MAIPSAINPKIMDINIFLYTLWCYKICRNNISFSLEKAHSSERKLGSSKILFLLQRRLIKALKWNLIHSCDFQHDPMVSFLKFWSEHYHDISKQKLGF